ncbi:MAG: DUF5134 domain-containing protein [Mycobacterium sp.]|nr:MAG: DUF5134 domain-containing protein [Mycobacterium sp.]
MIHDLLLRWVVTALFALGATECGLPLLIRRLPATAMVSHGLHLLMAISMAVMAWPWGTQVPTLGPAVFFLLGALWFLTVANLADRRRCFRKSNGYHALMMLATAWMYVSMTNPVHVNAPHSPSTPMPGMDMAAMDTMPGSETPSWFTAVNWLGAGVFTIAAVFWVSKYFVERRHITTRFGPLGDVAQAMTAAAMAILFGATLFAI